MMGLSDGDSKRSLEAQLDDVLGAIQQHFENWVKTATECGSIGGVTIAGARWSGVTTPAACEGLSVRRMHGFVYFGLDGREAIQIMCQNVEPGHVASFKAREAAVLTICRIAR